MPSTHKKVIVHKHDRDSVNGYVAPADADLSSAAGLDAVRAFRLEKLDAVVLHRGTWHWGPFPLGDEPVLLFNVQGLGYAKDNASFDLRARGVQLVVVES